MSVPTQKINVMVFDILVWGNGWDIIIFIFFRQRVLLSNRYLAERKEMFYLMTHSTHFIYGYMVKYHSDSERGNPLPPHRLLFLINSKGCC